MNEMVNRAAKAACRQSAKQGAWGTVRYEDGPELDVYVEKNWEWWQGGARAVIEVMREPTEAMIEAGDGAMDWDSSDLNGSLFVHYSKGDAATSWRAMIDKAMEP